MIPASPFPAAQSPREAMVRIYSRVTITPDPEGTTAGGLAFRPMDAVVPGGKTVAVSSANKRTSSSFTPPRKRTWRLPEVPSQPRPPPLPAGFPFTIPIDEG
jgi:hypothetical protein